MAGFLNRIFKPNKKRDVEDFSRRGSFRPTETFAEGAGLKSSMRRRVQTVIYEDDPLVNPTAPYHYDIQPQRHKGPRSLPPRMMNEYSPNESPSSSTDFPQERSFHSEFQSSAQGKRRSKHSMFSPTHKRSQRRRHRDYRDSDSENNPYEYENQLEAAMKQIKKYKTSLAEAIDEKRRLEREKTSLEIQMDEFARSRRKYAQEIRLLREENMKMKQRIAVLENEVTSYQSYHSTYFPYQQSFMYQHRMPFTFSTPPNPRLQLNNTNTGNSTLVGSQLDGGFRPPPIGDGSGESLAFMSATTTASNGKLPGMSLTEETQDEVKVFRHNDETSPSRPPTNCISNQSFDISSNSGNLRVSTSANSSPENKSAEKTPTASQKTQTEDPRLLKFNRVVTSQIQEKKKKQSESKFSRYRSTPDIRFP
ncbi:hypothetical protein FO519_008746 [Halicephalobus sp. NKZ332]|nr:hypothetical protein FO519_008746 [Halicephalobus sp. NKZ332]